MTPGLLFVLCATSGVLIPAPEDLALLVAGMNVDAGELSFPSAMAAACAGVLVRDSLFYGVGRLLGAGLFKNRWVLRLVGEGNLERARATVAERGSVAVLMGRAMVGFRSAAFLVAGAMGVKAPAFLLWDAIGLLVSVPLIMGLGMVIGAPALAAGEWIVAHPLVVLAAAVAAVVAGVALTRARAASAEAAS